MANRAVVFLMIALACTTAVCAQNGAANASAKLPVAQQAGTARKSPQKDVPAKAGDYFEARVKLPEGSQRHPQDVVQELGNPLPFMLRPSGNDSVLIYCHAASLKDCDSKLLDKLKGDIATLSGDQFVEVIPLEHASYVGDIVKAAQGLNYTGITVTAAGPDAIRVTCAVSCPKYDDFRKTLRNLVWKFQPQAPASRVYYLSASDAATALGGGTSASKADKSGGSDGASATVTVQNLAASNVGPCPASAKGDSGDKPGSSGTSDSSDSDPTKTDSSGKSGSEGSKVSGCPPEATAAANKGDAKSKDSSKPAVSVAAVSGDDLVFSDANPGDDAQIAQKKRVLALIDFPRPEVLINTFSFEASASNSTALSTADSKRQRAIGNYNDAFQFGLDRAWRYLQGEIDDDSRHRQGQLDKKEFFDPAFYDYLTRRFVANSVAQWPADKLLWNNDMQRKDSNVCGAKKYCLGYTALFNPLRPNLTDMLLAVVASADPKAQFKQAIAEMQHFPFAQDAPDPSKAPPDWENLSCDQRDAAVWEQSQDSQLFPMYCFQSFISDAFLTEGKPSAGGPLRAALVNFLFQYKMSQQYPREFSAYELSQTAQELNSELNPLIVAFNRDLSAALQPIRNNMDPNLKPNGWFAWAGHGSNFVDNGLITVRTVSGKETVVDTQTQSFFDVTNAPSITDVISSIKSAESNVPTVLKTNLTANEAAVIIGALNSVQPATSQVGRQFKIDITPHSLSGASSAELDVKLTTGDSAPPTRYSGGKSSADNISRVAKNNIDTKVRLESIKLFEISSLTAVVRQSRHNFPLLPPFVEIPYINSFVSFPVPGAKEYHRSTAVMSAVIVPTAADLASGVVFSLDRVLFPGSDDTSRQLCINGEGKETDCITKRALSLRDFGSRNISEFNKKMASCFANLAPAKLCSEISFDDVLPGN